MSLDMSSSPEPPTMPRSDVAGPPDGDAPPSGVFDPQRLLRIAGLTREVLDEARRIKPEPGAVAHLQHVHGQITDELRQALPPELYHELDELTPDLDEGGSLEELALAHAEILGWLEGLFQGTQLALQVQAMRAAERAGRPLPGARPSSPAEEPPSGSQYL
jgi:hypothetical protein